MHDFRDDYEMDEDGKLRKKKRVTADRERITSDRLLRQAFGFPHLRRQQPRSYVPHQPGYRFLDNNDADRVAANASLRGDAYASERWL